MSAVSYGGHSRLGMCRIFGTGGCGIQCWDGMAIEKFLSLGGAFAVRFFVGVVVGVDPLCAAHSTPSTALDAFAAKPQAGVVRIPTVRE